MMDSGSSFVCLTDLEELGPAAIQQPERSYICGGSGDEITLKENIAAYERIRLVQRVLHDVSPGKLDTRTQLLGRERPHPILLAPTANHSLVHPDGEVETLRGAIASRAIWVMSTLSSVSVEELRQAAGGEPFWFQLYIEPSKDGKWDLAERRIERVIAAGCPVICMTVDTPIAGSRYREQRQGWKFPESWRPPMIDIPTAEPPATVEDSIYLSFLTPSITWKDVAWVHTTIRGRAKLLLKGIMTAADAQRAADSGVDGIIVSNHGARNLDTVPATIDLLPSVKRAVPKSYPVLIDGGIRRGTDILKAIGRGATAVLIGRPYLYGLALNGSEGVKCVVEILLREFLMAMALTGCHSLVDVADGQFFWEPERSR